MKTQAGGSAAINGMLYQILGCIDQAMQIQKLSTTERNGSYFQTNLIIEPAGGGGDLQIDSANKRIVQQWKAKSNKGTWSFTEFKELVLPDLYKSIIEQDWNDDTDYVFVTEGRIGTWTDAYQFFQRLGREPPTDIASSLDTEKKIWCSPSLKLSELDIFLEFERQITEVPSISDTDTFTIHRKIWLLLSRFKFITQYFDQLTIDINQSISEKIEAYENTDSVRLELCGIVAELAARGDTVITPEALMKKAEVTARSFKTEWTEIRENLVSELESSLKNIAKYDRFLDVRQTVYLPDSDSSLVLAGESGSGKSWRLARLAHETAKQDILVVFCRSAGEIDKTLQDAADTIWLTGKEHETSKNLDIVARRYQKTEGEKPVWLLLCIDDVQSEKEATEILEKDWGRLGIQLAISTSARIRERLEKDFRDKNLFSIVDSFSQRELKNYLDLRGYDWTKFPVDIRELLKIPVLAKIFCDLPKDNEWVPINEYQLFEKYWDRLDDYDHPGKRETLVSLVCTLFTEESPRYPWPALTARNLGMDGESQKWLELKGWINPLPQGKIEIWHDRLLNWAVAEALIEYRRIGQYDPQEIVELINRLSHQKEEDNLVTRKVLGYLPLDFLWLVINDEQVKEEADKYLAMMEKAERWSGNEVLYQYLLPTLGEKIVPTIVARIHNNDDDSGTHEILASNCLIKLGEIAPNEVKKSALSLIKEECREAIKIGLKVLSQHPDPKALDQLWSLYEVAAQKPYECSNEHWKGLIYRALKACLKHNSDWLFNKINKLNSHDSMEELTHQLSELEGEQGKQIWIETKQKLFQIAIEPEFRSLVRCIDSFLDYEETERLEEWLLIEDDSIDVTAFQVLCFLAPEKAILSLGTNTPLHFSGASRVFLPYLVLQKPSMFYKKIQDLTADSDATLRNFLHWFHDNENLIDLITFNRMLDCLERELKAVVSCNNPRERIGWIGDWVSKVTSKKLLACLSTKKNSTLEKLLSDLGSSWVGCNKTLSFDRDLHTVRTILFKISGNGFTHLINYELASKTYSGRRHGYEWAHIRPDNTTKLLLQKNVLLESLDNNLREQRQATVALARIADWNSVIESILNWGGCVLEDEINELRHDQTEFTDEQLDSTLNAIFKKTEKLPNALLVLSISNRSDLAPLASDVLSSHKENSEAAFSALVALSKIGQNEHDNIKLISRHLIQPKHQRHAANALFNIGSEEALNKIQQYLESLSALEQAQPKPVSLLCALLNHNPDRKALQEIAWSNLQKFSINLVYPELVTASHHIDSLQFQNFLWEKAFSSPSGMRIVGMESSAVRHLADIDKEDAFEAAIRKLQSEGDDREFIPRILCELNKPKAIPILCKQSILEKETLCFWEIGLTLRLSQSQMLVDENLSSMLSSDDPLTRKAAAELCGWQSFDFHQNTLHTLAISDPYRDVREAAMSAIKRQRDEETAIELYNDIKNADDNRLWLLLDAIISLVDPAILTSEKSNLSLWPILKEKSYAYAKFVNQRLKKRSTQLEKEAKDADKDAH